MKKILFYFSILLLLPVPELAAAPDLKPHIAFAERGARSRDQTGMSLPGDVLILEETFEGDFPSGLWSIYYDGIDAYWDDVNCASAEGDWSAWCAAGGSAAQTHCTAIRK